MKQEDVQRVFKELVEKFRQRKWIRRQVNNQDQDLLFHKSWDGYWQRYRLVLVGTRKGRGAQTCVDGDWCAVYICTNPAFGTVGKEIVVTWKNTFPGPKNASGELFIEDSGYESFLMKLQTQSNPKLILNPPV